MSLESLTPEERQTLALGQLARKLVANPDTASTTKRLLMKGDPAIRFPEVELDDRLSSFQEKEAEKRAALEEEVRRLKAEAFQKKLHDMVRDAGHDPAEVITFLEKHGMPSTEENYNLALDVLSNRAADAAALAESVPGTFTPQQTVDTAEMWKDPVAWRQKQAAAVLTELGVGRRRRTA